MKPSSRLYKAGIDLMKISRTARILENLNKPGKLVRMAAHRFLWRTVMKGAAKLIGK